MALRGSHNGMVIIMTKLLDIIHSPRLNTLSVTGAASFFQVEQRQGRTYR